MSNQIILSIPLWFFFLFAGLLVFDSTIGWYRLHLQRKIKKLEGINTFLAASNYMFSVSEKLNEIDRNPTVIARNEKFELTVKLIEQTAQESDK